VFLPATFPDQEKIKLQSAVRNYTTFLYVGFVFGTLAPRAAVKAAPAAVASAQRFLAGGYDLTVTVAFFAAATLLLQARLARALRPSTNTKARLTPLAAWSLAVVTWCCITSVFHHCLTFGDENLGGYGVWAASAGASFANLFMSARTVMVSRRFSCNPFTTLRLVFVDFLACHVFLTLFLFPASPRLKRKRRGTLRRENRALAEGACLQAAVSSFIYRVFSLFVVFKKLASC